MYGLWYQHQRQHAGKGKSDGDPIVSFGLIGGGKAKQGRNHHNAADDHGVLCRSRQVKQGDEQQVIGDAAERTVAHGGGQGSECEFAGAFFAKQQ